MSDAPLSRLMASALAVVVLSGTSAFAAPIGATQALGVTAPPSEASRTAVLPRDQHGRAAVRALGEDLVKVARRNGLSDGRLTELLTEDETAWLTEQGQLYYVEDMPPEQASGEWGANTGSTTVPQYATSRTFSLHSRPGATRTIFLDFNGAVVKNTSWNRGANAMRNGTYGGYSADGNAATFTTAEHAWIQEVWREVAETYAPFDVDVTTQDGGASSRTRSSSSDTTFGTQVLFSNSSQAAASACNSTCLGVAYVGTFHTVDPTGYYQPAWVFTQRTTPAYIAAQGASHEVGHTLGLHHDGYRKEPYYAGTRAWGPIMGAASTRAVSQFSRGEYTGASQTEDDFAVIQANGLPLQADDHANTVENAVNLGTQQSYDASGVITSRFDQDVLAVNLECTTDLTVRASGIGPQTALDLRLDVLDATGKIQASANPAASYTLGSPPVSTGMNASVTLPAAHGTYWLRVRGVGAGRAQTTGWSSYGSVGQWRLAANGCTGATPSAAVTPTASRPPAAKRPTSPRQVTAIPGVKGGASTAQVRWTTPASNGGALVTKYRVQARTVNARGVVVRTARAVVVKPTARRVVVKLPKGRYRFVVMAYNRVGASPVSPVTRIVQAR